MEYFELVLSPVVWAMTTMLDLGLRFSGSAGVSILLLSLASSLFLYPIQRLAYRIERRFAAKQLAVQNATSKIDSSLKGERKFLAQEKVYKEFDYHPIEQLYLSLGILVSIPILISAIILFNEHPAMQKTGFLLIEDLSRPDGLLAGFNLMPVIMFVVTFLDAFFRFRTNPASLYRFILISGVPARL
ncbi:MAG: membrane protein insertase Oxa1/YidC/SpoIIIJ [Gammaproteobacteria bacterium]|jgi:membrane protein insertase Oxa1/YidC/SpoIIIJ